MFVDLTGLALERLVNGAITVTSQQSGKTVTNQVNVIYMDSGSGAVYVDFFLALNAYGITGVTRGLDTKIINANNSDAYGVSVLGRSSDKAYFHMYSNAGRYIGSYESQYSMMNEYLGTGYYAQYYLVDFDYFKKIMCFLDYDRGSDGEEKRVILNPQVQDAINGGSQREITPPNTITGRVNGVPKLLYPRDNWYSFSYRSGPIKDSQGRYKIAVGPRVLNPYYPDNGPVNADEFKLPAKIDIVLANKSTGELKTVECVVESPSKAHTYNKYPDNHPKNQFWSDDTASFDIVSGLFQTGIAYPKSWNSTHEPQFDKGRIDSSSIEFFGSQGSYGNLMLSDSIMVKISILN